MSSSTPYCQFCGKKRPVHPYGGVGPCDCEASKKASEAEYRRIKADREEREAAEHDRLHHLATTCNHEWVGGSLPFTCCKRCGITLGQYFEHR